MSIVWVDYVSDFPPVTARDVAVYESLVGHTFPKDYVAAVYEHAGQVTYPESVTVGRGSTPFGPLLFICENQRHPKRSYNALYAWDNINRWLGESSPCLGKYAPFATNTATGYFCFDFTEAETKITFIELTFDPNDEDAVIGIANSFSDLLSLLK